MFLEKSLDDHHTPLHFKHPSLLPLPIHHPFPPKNFDDTPGKTPEILHFHFVNVLQDCVFEVIFKWKRG